MAQSRPRKQPKGNSYPRLRAEFGGAILIYAPWLSILHGNPWNANIITGTPTRTQGGNAAHPDSAVLVRHNNSGITFPGTQSIDFTQTGISILAIGSMPSNSGVQINSFLSRVDNSANAGFEIDIYNKFAGNKDRIYGGYNKAGVDTNWDRGYVNGVSDSLNGTFTTTTGTRYVIACSADSGPGSNATGDIASGRASGSDSLFDIELVILWKRALSALQLRNLSVDPYYVFAPQRSFFAMAEPAGGNVSVALTGVQTTGSPGSVSVAVSKALTGVQATGSPGSVSVAVSKALTGVQATGSPGSVSVAVDKALTGVQATGSPGSVSVAVDKAITGVSSTGSPGSVAVTVDKALTGVQATGQVGQVGVDVVVALTGVQTTGQVGNVTPITGFSVELTGVETTGQVGQLSVAVDKALTGVQTSGQVGTVTPAIDKALTGVQATGSPGSVSVAVDKALTGVQATGSTGSVGVDVTVALTGVQATGQVGNVTPDVGGVSVPLTGVQATGQVGQVGVDVTVALTGVQTTGQVGNVGFPPPPAGPGSNALRRWLIQQYSDYFDEVDKAKEKAVREAEEPRKPVRKPRKQKAAYQVRPETTSEDDLSRATKLAMQELSARRAMAARLVRLERAFGVELPPVTTPPPPIEQDDDEDDLLLLAVL